MSLKSVIAVIDIGKTNAKVALVDPDNLTEVSVITQPNKVLRRAPYPHFDIENIYQFIVGAFKDFSTKFDVKAISVTTHGACGVLLDVNGNLATPVMDYEFEGIQSTTEEYNNIRPDFSETGSPRLPNGLNLGAQIYWLFQTYPELKQKTKYILTYAQYWSFRLCGTARNEMTSLGCHTDLWNPNRAQFSSMVMEQGWADMMAPIAAADEIICSIKPEFAKETGLNKDTPVYCGIHDSNASLYPHLVFENAPFSVVSTGTWVISMAIGGSPIELDPSRDTLINVNGLGEPVPSSRFMGGREFETLMKGRPQDYSEGDISSVLKNQYMLLPSIDQSSGPYQGRMHQFTYNHDELTHGEYYVVVSYYLALMTAACLDLIGSDGKIIVEGPFSKNPLYCQMLATAMSQTVETSQGTGTSIGAAMLALDKDALQRNSSFDHFNALPNLKAYVERWINTLEFN